jgi:hypothetical protein
MFKKILTTTCIITALSTGCAFAASSASLSQADADSKTTTENSAEKQARSAVIAQIVAASSMDEFLEQLPAMAAMGFDQQPAPPVDREAFDKFRTAVLQPLDPAKTKPALVRFIEKRYDAQRYAEVVALLNTPLSKKMTALELQASTPEAQQEMMQFANSMLSQPSPQRLALVERLDKAQQATESMVEMQIMMSSAMMKNMNRIVPADKKMAYDEIEQMLAQMREQSLPQARQFSQLTMVYTYRSVADSELEEYVRLVESDTGQYLTALLRDTFLNLFDNISVEVADHVGQNFKANNAF